MIAGLLGGAIAGVTLGLVYGSTDYTGIGTLLVGAAAMLALIINHQSARTRSELQTTGGRRSRRPGRGEPSFADRLFARLDAIDGRMDRVEEHALTERRINSTRHVSNVARFARLEATAHRVEERLGHLENGSGR